MLEGQLPIIVELGPRSGRALRALATGEGELVDEVAEALGEVRAALGRDVPAAGLAPVVVVFARKRTRRGWAIPLVRA